MLDSVFERLEKFIEYEPNSGCWLWSGAYSHYGHGFSLPVLAPFFNISKQQASKIIRRESWKHVP